MVDIRSPCTPPILELVPKREARIVFRHPTYPDTAPALLRLTAVDNHLNSGIDFQTALIACGIVACNCWHNAWFGQESGNGEYVKLEESRTRILPFSPKPYYFFVGEDEAEQYPVVPSFEHWRFPHDDLPHCWKDVPLDDPPGIRSADPLAAVRTRDQTCRLTGFYEECEVAHFVPLQHHGWFESNDMQRYCRLQSRLNPIDDDSNLILLRSDIHSLFDKRRFTVAPKTSSDSLPNIVLHVLLPNMHSELHTLYHNRRLHGAANGISIEFLFARFAWSILCAEMYPFLKGPCVYAVKLFDLKAGEQTLKDLQRDDIAKSAHIFSRLAYSRSVSSQKRKAGNADFYEAYEGDSDDYEEERTRGRRKSRSLDYNASGVKLNDCVF